MNEQLRDINQQLQEDARNVDMRIRGFNLVHQPQCWAYSVDRGAFHEGHVHFYRGVCQDIEQARALTAGHWKAMWQYHRLLISQANDEDKARRYIMVNMNRWKQANTKMGGRNCNDGEEQVINEVVGMFNELCLALQKIHAGATMGEVTAKPQQ